MGSHCSSICGSKPKRDAVDIERKHTNPTISNDSRQDYPAPPNLAYAQSYHASRQDFVHNKSQRFFIEYELKESIGVGTYGEVHRAIHKETGQERAVKIIEKEKIYPKEYGKLMEEVKILLGLDHPSILKIYDLYEDANHFYMVSELLKGGELFERIIEQKHLTEQGAAKIMRQVLSAIAYCHKYGVIHRDLKPENVIFDCKDSDTVKIIDFGLAQTFRPNQRFHECIGTAYYIAPEVVESQYDEKCDIWSCGVILYVMLSGRPPFSATNDDDVLNQVRFGEYDFDHPVWSEVSHEAKKLIKRMMKLDPKKRYSAQEALQDPWFKKYLEANPIDQPLAKEALSRLGSFRVGTKLQEATWIYLVSYFSTQEELNKLWHAFKALDQNNDGQLTKEDLTNAYIKIMGMTAPVAEAQADKIIATLDIDRDGRVNYTEFINAAASKQNILTKERLERAFKIFDKKGDGEITADELKDLFNHEKIRQIPGDIWKKWIEEVDKNKDGKISLEEFKNMMLNPIPVK